MYVLLKSNFTKLCNILLRQGLGSLLKLKPAGPKKSKMDWLGLVTNSKSNPGLAWAQKQVGNPSGAWLWLKSKLDIRAELGSGSEVSWISKLGAARAQT